MRQQLRFFPRLPGSPAARLALIAVGFSLWAIPFIASGTYGPATVNRMTDVTLRLAPVSLRSALLEYRTHLDRGVKETLASVDSAEREAILREAEREYALLPSLARSLEPFERVAWHFGRLAALAYLANDPLAAKNDARAASIHQDFLDYLERKQPLMKVSFDGYETPPFAGDVRAYLSRRLSGAARYREAVLFCYFPEGRRVSSDTFDDQSNAFGAAQSVLSHAVSDAAKLWFYAWKSMDGDVSATPFFREQTR
jgi:hypothetical protein